MSNQCSVYLKLIVKLNLKYICTVPNIVLRYHVTSSYLIEVKVKNRKKWGKGEVSILDALLKSFFPAIPTKGPWCLYCDSLPNHQPFQPIVATLPSHCYQICSQIHIFYSSNTYSTSLGSGTILSDF